MRSRNWQFVVGTIGGVVTILWILFQAWQAMTVNRPELLVFSRSDDLGLPSTHLRFLQDIDMSPRKDLEMLGQLGAEARERDKGVLRGGLIDTIKTFSGTPVVLGPSRNSVTTVKIVNSGRKTATSLKLFLPSEGFAEIQKDGAASRSEETKGGLELQSLEPGSRCIVRFWPQAFQRLDDIRVVSDDGPATVKPAIISNEEGRWVITFRITDVLILVLAGAMIGPLVYAALSIRRVMRDQ